MNRTITTRVSFVAACLIVAAAFTPAQDAELARALLMEEVAGRPADARTLYEGVVARQGVPLESRLRAEVGRARCLRLEGDFAAAALALDGIALIGAPLALRLEVDEERARLDEAVAARQDADPDGLAKRIEGLIKRGAWKECRDIGRPAVPVLVAFIESNIEGEGALDTAIRALVFMDLPEVPDALAGILRRGKLVERHRIPVVIQQGDPQSNPSRQPAPRQDLVTVVAAALENSDSLTRQHAAGLLAKFSAIGWETWLKALKDAHPSVREAAFDAALKRSSLTAEQQLESFGIAAADTSTEIRLMASLRLRSAFDIDAAAAADLGRRLLRDPQPQVRRAALAHVDQYALEERRELCFAAMSDADGQIRAQAVRALGSTAVVADVPRLTSLLFDIDEDVQSAVVSALARFPAEALLAATEDEARYAGLVQTGGRSIREFAISVLGRAGSKAVAPVMVDAFGRVSSSEVPALLLFVMRHDLTEALDRVRPHLGRAGGYSQLKFTPPNYRDPTGYSGSIDAYRVVTWLANQRHTSELIELLAHLDEVRDGASRSGVSSQRPISEGLAERIGQSLARHLPPELVPTLFGVLREMSDPVAAAAAVKGLDGVAGSSAVVRNYYREALSSSEAVLRSAAANALRQVAAPEDVDLAIDRIAEESDADVNEQLRRLVAEKAGASHLARLADGLRNPANESARTSFLHTIGRIGTPEAVSLLLDLLNDAQADKGAIFSYLAESKVPEGWSRIAAQLEEGDLDPTARRAAILALGTYGRPEAAPLLLAAARDHATDHARDARFKTYVRHPERVQPITISVHPSIIALHDLGPASFVSAAETILGGDFKAAVQADVIEILAFVPTADAERLIILNFAHEDARVRAVAAKSAGEALLSSAIPALRTLVRTPHPEVREAAESALLRLNAFGLNGR